MFFLWQQKAISQIITFDGVSYTTVFNEIELNSSYSFNYNPILCDSLICNKAQINLEDIDQSLKELFYKSKFDFEVNGNTILVIEDRISSYTTCGKIINANGDPLSYATISVNGKSIAQSDESGFFKQEIDAFKNDKISISFIGFVTTEIMVQDFPKKDCLSILLEHDVTLIGEEIVIKDYLVKGITNDGNFNAYDIDYKKLSQESITNEQDVLYNVQLLPGITSADETASNLNIRGSTSDQNLILWDGAPLYNSGHFYGMISIINPFVIKDMTVYKDGFDSSFDNRVGGIVDIKLSDKISNKLSGGAGLTMTESHAFLDIPIVKNKLSIIASGRRSNANLFEGNPTVNSYSKRVFQIEKFEVIEEELRPDDSELAIDYYDINGKLIFRPSDKIAFTSSYLNTKNEFNYDGLFNDGKIENINNSQLMNELFSNQLNLQWNNNLSTKFKFSNSRLSNQVYLRFDDSEKNELVREESLFNEINDIQLSVIQSYKLPRINTAIGYNFEKKSVIFDYAEINTFEEELIDESEISSTFHNLFFLSDYDFNKFSLDFGYRLILQQNNNSVNHSPRFGLSYAIGDAIKLKTSAGIYYQYINEIIDVESEDFLVNSGIWTLRDGEDFGPMEARKISIGASYQKHGFLFDVEAYRYQNRGLATINTVLSNLELGDNDLGESLMHGLDVLLKKKWSNYQLWFNYTISKNYFLFPNLLDFSFPASNDQLHNLSVVNNYQLKKLNFSLVYQYKTGLPFSEFSELEEDEDDYEINYEGINTSRLGNYYRFDFSINYRNAFYNDKLQFELGLTVVNIFDTKNVFQRNYLLADLEEDEEPEVYNVSRNYLGRTPKLIFRIYW